MGALPLWFALAACRPPPVAPGVPPVTLGARFGERPYLYPIDAPPTVALTAGGFVPSAAAVCGGCHPDHHAEWSTSTHAHATRDLQYVAELAKPGQPRWLCLSCHAPTRPQRWDAVGPDTVLADPPRIDAILATPEPTFDPARIAEGVGCATCHVRRDGDGEGVVVGPRGSGRAPHRVRRDPEALAAVCDRCHAPRGEPISPTFVCWFETDEELAGGPSPEATCSECHQPWVVRPAAVGGDVLEVRSHRFQGGGVPKTFAGYDALLGTGWQPAIDVSVTRAPPAVTLTNARAAHAVPTADPERHLVVDAALVGADGAVLARDQLRLGQVWDWGDAPTGRVAHRLADDRLPAGGSRTWAPALAASGAVALVVEVRHVRLTDENARGMAGATLDDELLRLWPEAGALLPDLANLYPRRTLVFRGSYPLDGAAPTITPLAELLAESADPHRSP